MRSARASRPPAKRPGADRGKTARLGRSSRRCRDQIDNVRDQRLVRGRHRIVLQPRRTYPGDFLRFLRFHHPLPAPADIERHQEMEFLVGMTREGKRRETILPHDDAELFPELADERVLGPLAWLDLAAGKLPKALHRLAG